MITKFKNKKINSILVICAGGITVLITLGLNHSNGLYLLPITNHLNIGRELYGLAGAFGILFSGIGAPVFGGFADKYGVGKTVFVMAILQIISWAWLGNANSSLDLFGSRILMGFGSSGVVGIALAATGRSVSTGNRSLFVGLIMASGSFGQFIMVPMINLILTTYGWVNASFVASILVIPIILMAYFLSLTPSALENNSTQKQTVKEALTEAFKNRSYNLLTLGFFVCGFHVTFVATHLPAFLEDKSIPNEVAGWALALIGLFNIVGTITYGYLGSRLSKKNLLSILYTLRSVLFLLFILSPKTNLSVLIFASVLGILWLSTVPLTNGIIADIFGQSYTSMLFGITLLSHHIGSFLGSWLGGRFFDYYGSYDPVWWICVALGFAAAIVHYPIVIKPVVRLKKEILSPN